MVHGSSFYSLRKEKDSASLSNSHVLNSFLDLDFDLLILWIKCQVASHTSHNLQYMLNVINMACFLNLNFDVLFSTFKK